MIGDIQSINLPKVGDQFEKNQTIGKLESANNIFSIYSPINGKVVRVNPKVFEDCTYINQNAENFWLVEYKLEDEADMHELLEEGEYNEFLESQTEINAD